MNKATSLRRNFVFGKGVRPINFVNLGDKEKDLVRIWRNNEKIKKWFYTCHTISASEHNNFIKRLKTDDKNFYWLVKEDSQGYIGVINLIKVDFRNGNAYLGIYSNPEIRGVGHILMDCLKRLAFEVARLHTLKLDVIEENERAIKLYKREGFKREGKLEEFIFENGRWHDILVMGIRDETKKR